MKKIAGIIGGIALVLCMSSCSWQMPEKVSVKTQAEYNFSLGNFPADNAKPEDKEKFNFNDKFNIDTLLKDVTLPNNGKIYDYWPGKEGNTQRFLMYMPIQEIPINISEYFDKGSLADSIKKISFSKEIVVPEVNFETSVDIDLDSLNDQISNSFRLAGMVKDYSASEFGDVLSQFANYLSYEKGILVIKAYAVDPTELMSGGNIDSIDSLIGNSAVPDPTYSGSVTISSNGKYLTGYFNNGVAELDIGAKGGFDFKANDIQISFSNIETYYGSYPARAFIATIDTTNKKNRPYQIKSVNGLKMATTIPFSVTEEINSLSGLDNVEGCTIGEGSILLDFGIPPEWHGVDVSYYMSLTGGVNLSVGSELEPINALTNNPEEISLAGKSITPAKIQASVSCVIAVDNATIDFTTKPKIGFESDIKTISAVTVKLSDTSLSFDEKQALPDEVLDMVKSISLYQCGIKGTYTNTLPSENDITLSVFSDFFDIHKQGDPTAGYSFKIQGNQRNAPIEILSAETAEARVVKLSKNPSALADPKEYKEFDFKVDVGLPGGEANKITVQNVSPNQTYTFAINLEPEINWESVSISLASLPSKADTIGTGFNPSSIFSSLEDVLGKDFADNVDLPDCKLYLYLTKPTVNSDKASVFNNLNFGSSSISLFYGTTPDDDSTPQKIGSYEKEILKNGMVTKIENGQPVEKTISFVSAPALEADSQDANLITSNATGNASFDIGISDLLKKPAGIDDAQFEKAQLCVDYNISLNDDSNTGNNELKIYATDLDTDSAGSIGIYALIDLPLSFSITNDTNIDLMKIINGDKTEENNDDLFGRSEASGMDEIKDYIDAIKSVELRYQPIAFPINSSKSLGINVNFLEGQKTTPVVTKHIDVSTNEPESIEITLDDMDKMLNAYPLKIGVAIDLAANTDISIPREKEIKLNLEISLETDGEIPLMK